MKKTAKKLTLAKETVRHLDRMVELGQVAGGTLYEPRIHSPSDTSYTGCDVCQAATRVSPC